MASKNLPPPNTSVTQTNARKKIFKIIIIGDSNVGKTCLTYRFCEGRFPKRTEATIGVDFREKNIPLENDAIKLQIWDTAGQERFRRSMVPHYYRSVNAVVFVYDITKPETFYNLPFWIEECNHYNLTSEIPRLLVGNKCDEIESAAGKEDGDVSRPSLGPIVGTHVAQRFADEHQMPLFETSAKDDSRADHVEAIFLTLAHKLRNSKPMMAPSYGRSLSNNSAYSNVQDRPYAPNGARTMSVDEPPHSGFSCC